MRHLRTSPDRGKALEFEESIGSVYSWEELEPFPLVIAEDSRETSETALSESERPPTTLLLERGAPYETPVLLIYPRNSDREGGGTPDSMPSVAESNREPTAWLLRGDTPSEVPVLLIYVARSIHEHEPNRDVMGGRC